LTTAKPIDPPLVLPNVVTVDVLILPRRIGEDGVGLYDDSVLTLAKELREAGAQAEYQHATNSRRWIGEKGVPPVVLDLLIGIAGNAGWAALRAVCRGHKNQGVRVRVARCKQKKTETQWEWFEAEGPGGEVATAIEALEPSAANEPRDESDAEA
jgi:hypothetical protein